MLTGKHRYDWGDYDGSGGVIKLTGKEYFKRFIYNRDFATGKVSSEAFKSRGNTINNLRVFYPNALLVEHYLPGTPKYGGMDWNSLWLVWQPHGSSWYLAGIAHGEWTT
jgi:hypothetical protein